MQPFQLDQSRFSLNFYFKWLGRTLALTCKTLALSASSKAY